VAEDTKLLSYGFKFQIGETPSTYIDLSDYFVSAKIDYKINSHCSWNIVLQDDENLTLSPSKTLGKKLLPDVYDTDKWSLKRWFEIKVRHGSKWKKTSKLIPHGYNYNEKTGQIRISGYDKSRNLYIKGQNMDPWENEKASVIIKEILENFKIEQYNINLAKDWYIRSFDFANSSAIDKLREIFFVGMATWFYYDDTFYVVPDNDKDMPDWEYENRKNIYELTYDKSLGEYYNRVKVGRTMKGTNVCEYEGTQVGFHLESLCAKLNNPRPYVVDVKSGTIEQMTFLDDDGGYSPWGWDPSVTPPPQQGWHLGLSGPATQFSFIYKQKNGLEPTDLLYYKIRVKGINPDNIGPYGVYETFHHTEDDEDGQKEYGIWEYSSVVDNPLIPYPNWAETLAKWILRKSRRNVNRVTLRVPLNMFLRPTDTIKIETYRTGLSDLFHLEAFSHTLSASRIDTAITSCAQYKDSHVELPVKG